LLVAPIPDPYEIVLPQDLRARTEQVEIGRLMPGENLTSPALSPVCVAQHITESKDAVEPVEIERADRVGIGHDAMVRVMEQQQIMPAAAAMRGEARHQCRLVPFVHQHDFGAVESAINIEPC